MVPETTSMNNSVLTEIKLAGEKQVKGWLTENGYFNIVPEVLNTNEVCLAATGSIENILVQVRSFLHPHRPFKLSDFETDILVRRAIKKKLIAYVAYVAVDENGNLCGEISWERLSQ